MDHVKDYLVSHLASIGEARTWSSYGPILTDSPTPGLYLKDGDIVGLPLSPHGALRIKKHASQSKDLHKSDNMRCELNPSQFETRNPAWYAFVQSMGSNATKPFDIGPVHLALRRLILSDKNSDTAILEEPSKDSDVIGSMAIVLSSHHEGGDVKLTFGKETRRFPTAPTSNFSESFIAWYSDVQVDAEPIISGYRLQLVYNVHQSRSGEKKPSASYLSQQTNEFQDVLGQWTALSQNHEGPVPLVYILEDELGYYKRLPLSYAFLKDADKHKMNFLQRQCLEKDVLVFMAKLTTSIDGNTFGDDEEPNTNMELHDTMELDGQVFITEDVGIEKQNIMPEEWFEARDSNDSDYDTPEPSDPWEDEDEDSCPGDNTRHFKNWVFVLLPASQRLQFLAKNTGPDNLHAWIVRLSNVLKPSDYVVPQNGTGTAGDMLPRPQEDLKRELDVVCTRAIDRMQSWRRHKIGLTSYLYHHDNPNFAAALEAVVRATMILEDPDLVREAVIECPTKLSLALWRDIGKYLDCYTLETYEYGLNLALRQIPTIHEKNLVLQSIVSGYRDISYEASKKETHLDQWVLDRLKGTLNTLDHVEEQDGQALISISKEHGRDLFLGHVIPFAKRHASNLPFASDFATGVCEGLATRVFDPDMVCLAVREVFSVMIPAFAIEDGRFSAKRRKIARTSTASVGEEDMDRWSLAGSRIAHLVGCCHMSDLEDEGNDLLDKVASEASSADDRTLNTILMPFLQTLRHIMERDSVSFETQGYQHLFQYIIALFIVKYVKMETPKPANQSCPKAGCGTGGQCRDCWDLDEFLRHPSSKYWDLTTTGQRRDHVEHRVLESQSPYFRCDTIKNSHAPHTLKVTKTVDEAWEASHSAWLSRCTQARETFTAIGHDALKQLLGNRYDEFVELRSVRHGQTPSVLERPSLRKG